MDLTRIDTIIQFTQSATAWNDPSVAVPAGAVVIDTTNKIIKEGDGTTLFENLPVCLDYNFQAATSGAVTLVGDDVGDIAISDDALYSTGATKLDVILASIVSKTSTNTTQDANITTISNDTDYIANVSEGAIDGTIVICQNGQYVPGTKTLTQMIADLVAAANVSSSGMHIADIEWYTDSDLTNQVVEPNQVSENNIYWCKITGFHDSCELRCVSFEMTSSADVTINQVDTEATAELKLITNAYSSAGVDEFHATCIDTSGNIFAVGKTTSSSNNVALIVKFNSEFDVIARKLYTGVYSNSFSSVIADGNNDIVAVGSYITEVGGNTEAFVVKFTNDLSSIAVHKTYGGSGEDAFNDIAVGPSGNYYVVGYTASEGSGLKDALIVKLSPTLTILYKKRYGGVGNEVLNGVTLDATGNAICVGYTGSEGANASGLVLKLDSNLNVVLRKYYNSTFGTATEFNAVAVTAANVIYIAGRVVIASGNKGLIAKLDSSLNSTAAKLYGNSLGSTEFTGIVLDSSNNIFVAGKTNAEGAGGYDALIMKYDSSLMIVGRKTYGTVGDDSNIDCIVSNDSVIISGYSILNGSTDGIITKVPNVLPTGTYTNKYLNELILNDSNLTLSNDSATVISSTLSMMDSNLTFVNSTMTLSNANGAIVKDITIMDPFSNVFRVEFNDIVNSSDGEATFTVTTNDGEAFVTKNISVIVKPATNVLCAVYSGDNIDEFKSIITDATGNIYAVGSTFSEGDGATTYSSALIVKFDSSLNKVAAKVYGGSSSDNFYDIAVDSSGSIYAIGYTFSEGINSAALIVKFDSSLNKVAAKVYGGSSSDNFYDIAVDSSGSIYAIGYTFSEGDGATTYSSALIVKFDSSLTILNRKIYNGDNVEEFRSVDIDSAGNVYVVGITDSEGSGSANNYSALIIKFDSSLNILARKIYNGANVDEFRGIVIDSSDNVYAVGYTSSEGAGSIDALIVKFDTSLNKVASKVYGGTNDEYFYNAAVDSSGNIYAVGHTKSEGPSVGTYNSALIVKFDSSLNKVAAKVYGGTAEDYLRDITIDSDNNIYLVGDTNSEDMYTPIVRAGFILKLDQNLNKISAKLFSGVSYDNLFGVTNNSNNVYVVGSTYSEGVSSTTYRSALIVKLTLEFPAGTSIGDSLLFTLADSVLTFDNSALTLSDSTLTLSDSVQTLSESTLTLATSNLTLEIDTIG